MANPRAGAALTRLREQTAPSHARLEGRLGRFEWLESLDSYAGMLERLHRFYAHAERELALGEAPLLAGLELEQRRKAPLLAGDLASLGRALPLTRRLHPVAGMPAMRSPGRALGCLYVLEGATLGGKVIEREVRRRLGLERDGGTSFFGAYGSQVGARWRAFCEIVEREARALDLAGMTVAAQQTFDALEGCLGA